MSFYILLLKVLIFLFLIFNIPSELHVLSYSVLSKGVAQACLVSALELRVKTPTRHTAELVSRVTEHAGTEAWE